MTPPAYCVFDLETTGLDPEQESIIEIGAIAVDEELREMGEFHTLVQPRTMLHFANCHEVVRKMHTDNGLFAEFTVNAPSLLDADVALAHWLGDLGFGDREVILAGHTIDFDHAFVTRWMPISKRFLSHRKLDFGQPVRFLSAYLGIELPEVETPHRALPDCRLELERFRSVMARLRGDVQDARAFRLRVA